MIHHSEHSFASWSDSIRRLLLRPTWPCNDSSPRLVFGSSRSLRLLQFTCVITISRLSLIFFIFSTPNNFRLLLLLLTWLSILGSDEYDIELLDESTLARVEDDNSVLFNLSSSNLFLPSILCAVLDESTLARIENDNSVVANLPSSNLISPSIPVSYTHLTLPTILLV